MGGRAKFADECESILRSVLSRDGGSTAEQISEDSGLPACQVVDLICNYLSRNVKTIQSRAMGVKVTLYVAQPS